MKTNTKIIKRSLVLSLLLLFAGSSLLNAQIKVNTDNIVNIGNTASPLIKVDPNSGVVRVGNTTSALFDANTRFEANVPETKKVVISSFKRGSANPFQMYAGFQFCAQIDTLISISPPLITTREICVMEMTGLSNKAANIGRIDNYINRVYTDKLYTNGGVFMMKRCFETSILKFMKKQI